MPVDESAEIRRLAELAALLDRVCREAHDIREDLKRRSRRSAFDPSIDLTEPQTPRLDNEQRLRQDAHHSS